ERAGVLALPLDVAELRIDVGHLPLQALLLRAELVALATDLLQPLARPLELGVGLGRDGSRDEGCREHEIGDTRYEPPPRATIVSRISYLGIRIASHQTFLR